MKNTFYRIRGNNEDELKSEQVEIIKSILKGKDSISILPTGFGKSVCYQVPALMLEGVTLVVTPLVSLMQDQVEGLHKQRIPVACMSGKYILDSEGPHHYRRDSEENESESKRKRIRNIFVDTTKGKYKIIYLTPERLRSSAFVRFSQRVKISFIAVDEAHCISLWGYEFRRRYLELSRFIRKLGYRPTVAAFTATATKAVLEDIKTFLFMKNPKVRQYSVSRPNLTFHIAKPAGDKKGEALGEKRKEKLRQDEIIKWIQKFPDESGIVYCPTTEQVNIVYDVLVKAGLSVTRYYSELGSDSKSKETKDKNFRAWREGNAKTIVTTNALGMGVDKSDVRFVIHASIPLSLEHYYQEAGRAARAPQTKGDCVLIYLPQDENTCKTLLEQTLKDSDLSNEDLELRREISRSRISEMVKYCNRKKTTDTKENQAYIIDYFNNFSFTKFNAAKSGAGTSEDLEKEVRARISKEVSSIDVVCVNRTMISHELRKGITKRTDMKVGRKGTDITVSFELTGEPLDYYDFMIADAVYTLMINRVKTIHARQIMALLSGDADINLRPERKEFIVNRIKKMMKAHITIDRSKSMSMGFLYDDERAKGTGRVIQGPFLPLKEERSGFSYNRDVLPPLYEYAEISNSQFYYFFNRMLNVKGLPTQMENLALVNYILRRTESMKQSPGRSKTSNVISFDSIIKSLGIELPRQEYYRKRKEDYIYNKEIKILKHLIKIKKIRKIDENTSNRNIKISVYF